MRKDTEFKDLDYLLGQKDVLEVLLKFLSAQKDAKVYAEALLEVVTEKIDKLVNDGK